jgi:hypothetical protein
LFPKRRYLYFAEPVLPAAQVPGLKKVVQDFRAGDGPKLQQHLEAWNKVAVVTF